jgi:hypothetical protein
VRSTEEPLRHPEEGIGQAARSTVLTGITDASVTDASITDASITDASITDASITDASITDASITDASVTGASVTDPSVVEAGVGSAAIGVPTVLRRWLETALAAERERGDQRGRDQPIQAT